MEVKLAFCYEVVRARGHSNIKGTHKTTFEITKDSDVTPRGNCIIGTSADKAPADFSSQFKECLKSDDAVLFILLEANDVKDIVVAHGHSQLLLTDEKKLIVRKSTFIEPATIGILASKSSAELRRELINALKKRDTYLTAHLLVLRLDQITSVYTQLRRVL